MPAAARLTLYCPLYGAAFDSDSDAVGEIARGVAVYVPAVEEWRTVRKMDPWKPPPGAEGAVAREPQPPCCIVTHTALPEGPHHPNAIAACGIALLTAARSAVVVLRLFRGGWFLHPEQSMQLYYAPTLPLSVLRAPGPYRQVFATGVHSSSLPPYELRIGELTRTADMPGPIEALWHLLQAYRLTGGDLSVELAIESFNRSYGYQLLPHSRAGNLFTALEAMLGGMNAWRIGSVPVSPRGYARRAEAALRTSAAPQPMADARATGAWLASASGARGLRNAIAHGEPDGGDAPARDAYERLQSIVRSVLYQYLHFAAQWLAQRRELADRLTLDDESPLTAAYVTALEAEALKPGSMIDLLQ
jgi:hypothetical protein